MRFVIVVIVSVVFGANASAAPLPDMNSNNTISIRRVNRDLEIAALNDQVWRTAAPANVTNYWSGESAPDGRHFEARLLWSRAALYVRFEANQTEPLVISSEPDLTKKTRGLWNRDVCEIFIAPDRKRPAKYFEFEVAPTGEWIDLGIEVTPTERLTDWEYRSGMEVAAKIEKNRVVMAIKIPFAALGSVPKAGDVWLGNLFRCVGKDPARGYLAWRPTKTNAPNFHVPAAFGEFRFTE